MPMLRRQCEGAQLLRRCSHKSMSTFATDEHLQAGGSSREGVAALGRSIQLLLVFVSTVEPNHDPPQGAHCAGFV